MVLNTLLSVFVSVYRLMEKFVQRYANDDDQTN